MGVAGIGPFKQAFVRALRDIAALQAVVGSKGIHEGIAPRDIDYPYVVYRVAYAPIDYEWGTATHRVGIDVRVVSDDQVQAHNLDQLIADALDGISLNFEVGTGLSTLFCRRVASLSHVALDEQGERVYQVLGTYEIWASQRT